MTSTLDAQYIVVEQDASERLPRSQLPAGVEHVFAFNPGAFNRSWGFNVGAARAEGTVLMLMDGDLLIEHWALNAALDACLSGVEAVNPYGRLVELSPAQSDRLCASTQMPNAVWPGTDRSDAGEYICFCGGAYLIDASFYRRIGGQDERFKGWGGEDDAMSIKVSKLACRTIALSDSTAYHLFHPREDISADAQYARNKYLVDEYRTMTEDQLLSVAHSPIGDADKYRTGPGSLREGA